MLPEMRNSGGNVTLKGLPRRLPETREGKPES